MRDIALFAVIFGLLLFVFSKPFVGVMLFTWVSLMNPHRLTYGAAYDFPFAALIVVVTLFSLLVSKQKKNFPVSGAVTTLLLFILWMTISTFVALEPLRAWPEWNRVMKTMFLFGVILLTVNTKEEIQALAWMIALSLGFFGFKGGLFTISSGGTNHVFGPDGSYITDNNALALALVTALPIIWYTQLIADRKLLRFAMIGLAMLTVISAVGSYSRGALVGGAAMLILLWLKSRNKIRTGLILLLIIPLIYVVMPPQWFDRMHSIDNYQQDGSALGRFNAWGFAMNIASSNLMGGGFDCFTNRLFLVYAPDPLNQHAAHSIYFQVLGEHGYVGLFLFLLFMFLAWRTGSRILKFCKGKEDLKWAADLAAMCQVSLMGFAVGGAFLTLAYYDLYYDIVALLLLLEKILLSKNGTSTETMHSSSTLALDAAQQTK